MKKQDELYIAGQKEFIKATNLNIEADMESIRHEEKMIEISKQRILSDKKRIKNSFDTIYQATKVMNDYIKSRPK